MLNENGACHMMVSLVLQLCMFLGIAMGKILCYDNCMMKNILKNKQDKENDSTTLIYSI